MLLKRFLPIIIYSILFYLILWLLIINLGIDSIQSSDRGAIISAIVAIFVFGSGLLAQMIGNKIKQFQKDRQLKRVSITNLKTISEGLKLQLNNFSKIIETLKSPSPESILLSSYAELEYFEINKISSEDLYRIFIDYQKGDEKEKINTLESLRKELRFIEYSRELILIGFEKLYNSFQEYSNTVIDGVVALGEFFDKEATNLLHNQIKLDTDKWFVYFTNLWREARSALKTSDDTFTNYEKLELEIIPRFFDFARDFMSDPRTPVVTAAFSKANTAIYQRRDVLNKLINLVEFYSEKYNSSKRIIDKSLSKYDK